MGMIRRAVQRVVLHNDARVTRKVPPCLEPDRLEMTEPREPVIVWFRQDLRLSDNPALLAARDSDRPVLPVFILDLESPGAWAPGPASLWWLHHSLESLSRDLEETGARLWLGKGKADEIIPALAREVQASAVYWNRRYEPWAIARDSRLKSALKQDGVEVRSFNAGLLIEPWDISTNEGKPYRVYTPFWKSLKAKGDPRAPGPRVERLDFYGGAPESDALSDWNLLPAKPDWAGGLRETWTPGEAGAHERLETFLDERIADYDSARNRPGTAGTSGLSAHLHHGEISPHQVWHAVKARAGGSLSKGEDSFLSEIGWREFCYNLLYHFPEFPEENYQDKFDAFPWKENEDALTAWKKGLTGYPIVDAGMRQLWQTGWMHNRVRMIAGSFLVKDLMIDWRRGEDWFWHTLVDADLANNAAGWQWIAGSGADAAPFFRIFNPVSQGEKFDAQGRYVRRWVPELAGLPDAFIHKPWEADRETLRKAGVTLGKTYPRPIVDHKQARERALEAWNEIKDAA